MLGGLAAKKLGVKPDFTVKIDGPPDSFRLKWKKMTTSVRVSDELYGSIDDGGISVPEEFSDAIIKSLGEKIDREFMKGGGDV